MVKYELQQWDEIEAEVYPAQIVVDDGTSPVRAIEDHISQLDAQIGAVSYGVKYAERKDGLVVATGLYGQDKRFAVYYHPNKEVARSAAEADLFQVRNEGVL